MKFTLTSNGSWLKTQLFLANNLNLHNKARAVLKRAAEEGVEALAANTPKDSGLAADSWGYEITIGPNESTITWTNSDIEGGYNVALLVQYGHGVKGGGYIQGRDYINPAIQPIFDNLADTIWREVISS